MLTVRDLRRDSLDTMSILQRNFQFFSLSENSFVSVRDELENTITQQRRQIEDLLKDKGQLYAQLVQSHERTAFLQKEVFKTQPSWQRTKLKILSVANVMFKVGFV